MSLDRFMIGEAIGVSIIIGVGLGLRFAADDVAYRADADLPAMNPRAFVNVRDVTTAVVEIGEGRKQEIATLRREISPGSAKGRVHRDGARNLQARRSAHDAFEAVIFSFEIERLASSRFPIPRGTSAPKGTPYTCRTGA